MKKPRIEAEEPQSRKIIRADKAPVSGYSLVRSEERRVGKEC